MPQFLGKIIFLENYDMVVAKRLVTGVDIWLNTPTRPLEASGTSGEKAEMNGVLNFSVLDGWWYEGYREGAGWALTDKRTFTDQSMQDRLDAATIYSTLENEIVPLYFNTNDNGYSPEWIKYIKNSIAHIAPNFTMTRMINDYIDRFYSKEGERSTKLMANNYAVAKELAAWKENVAQKWNDINVVDIQISDSMRTSASCGEDIEATVVLNTVGLGRSIGVDLVTHIQEDNQYKFHKCFTLEIVKEDGIFVTYHIKTKLKNPGSFRYSFRVFPTNENMAHRQDFAYVKWI